MIKGGNGWLIMIYFDILHWKFKGSHPPQRAGQGGFRFANTIVGPKFFYFCFAFTCVTFHLCDLNDFNTS